MACYHMLYLTFYEMIWFVEWWGSHSSIMDSSSFETDRYKNNKGVDLVEVNENKSPWIWLFHNTFCVLNSYIEIK